MKAQWGLIVNYSEKRLLRSLFFHTFAAAKTCFGYSYLSVKP